MIIPRGRISHSLTQSLKYTFMSLVSELSNKKIIRKLEISFSKYIGRKHCIAFPHARTAIYFILKQLNLPKGSKIIMPAMTIKFILDVVVSHDLEPVYVDYDLDTYSFDIDQLRNIDTDNIKVMLVTPLFGVVPRMDEISIFCKERNIFLIEDFSQCLNGKLMDKKIGSFGDVSVYSASSIKTLDTLGGGLLVTDDKNMDNKLRLEEENLKRPKRLLVFKRALINLIRNFATNKVLFNLITINAIKILSLKNKENAMRQTGTRNKERLNRLPDEWFFAYSSVQAKVALENIDSVIYNDNKRIKCAEFYINNIGKKYFANGPVGAKNVYWQLPIKINDSSKYHYLLRSKGVDSALTSLQLICSLENYPGHRYLKNANIIFNDYLFIPCYSHLKKTEIKKVSKACINILQDSMPINEK